ncbi:MAG TPA: 50S ribosomal protein L11 methyltransferase [Gemmatimonadaceae bacterium]
MTARTWTTVRVTGFTDRDAVIAALFGAGAEGVQELADAVVTHVADADASRITREVREADAGAMVTFAPTPDVDWSSEWRSRISAHRVGRLVVTPPWLADNYAETERIVIEPQMAFGTGEHETTRGVLRLLGGLIRPGDIVADLGAGSAVLSIAAAKLGASRVVAVELDPEAIGNAEANVRRNLVGDRVKVIEGDASMILPLIAPARVVLANIIWPVLERMLPVIASALTADGVAVLSGLLAEERPSIEASLAREGWRITAVDEEGIWWSASIVRF